MKSSEKNQGRFIYQGFANDNYLKSTVSYDTGMNENGWATSLLFTHWQGDGYAEGTYGQGQTYFVSIGYKANDKHSFNLMIILDMLVMFTKLKKLTFITSLYSTLVGIIISMISPIYLLYYMLQLEMEVVLVVEELSQELLKDILIMMLFIK